VGEAGAVQKPGPLVEPALGERPAGVAYGLQPVRRHIAYVGATT
jgi:hypothetical protein